VAISFVGFPTVQVDNDPTSGNWTLPGGWSVGDLAIFWWYTRNARTFTEPGTVTQKVDYTASGVGRLFVGYRYLESGDTTFGWTADSTGTSNPTFWGTAVFSGTVGSGDPFEAQAAAAYFLNFNDPDPAPVTPVTDGACVFIVFGKQNSYTSIAQPTNYTDSGSDSSLIGSDASIGTAYRLGLTGNVEEDPGAWDLGGGLGGDDGIIWTAAIEPGGGGAYTLTAESGSLALAGTAASLEYGRKLAAGSGAHSVAGTAASLEYGRKLGAAAGSYAVTGTAASLTYTPGAPGYPAHYFAKASHYNPGHRSRS